MDRRADIAVAAAFMALGLFIIWQATTIRLGMMRDPIGPRVAFYITGGTLALGGLVIILRSLWSSRQRAGNRIPNEGVPDEADYPASTGRALAIMGCCIAYGLTFDLLGYLIATPLFIIAALAILGERHAGRIVLIALIFTAVTYVIFAQALGVRVPVGPLTGPFRALGLINL
jgi:putative tricarboxylic transport membrane protein